MKFIVRISLTNILVLFPAFFIFIAAVIVLNVVYAAIVMEGINPILTGRVFNTIRAIGIINAMSVTSIIAEVTRNVRILRFLAAFSESTKFFFSTNGIIPRVTDKRI